MPTLSVIIPAYNEIEFIADAIQSVSFADEIIVIDSLSTDGTKEKALSMGCQVLDRKFDNYSAQKNHAITFAKGDWVLFLDADERVTQKLEIEIKAALKSTVYTAYKIRVPHFYMNRFLYHLDNKVIRLAINKNLKFEGDVHEKLIYTGKLGVLKNFLIHYTYKGLFHYLNKKDAYAWVQAKMTLKKNKKATFFLLVFKPFYRFFHTYFIRLGFLDGVPGLAVATIDAYGVLSRYAKMMLIEKDLK